MIDALLYAVRDSIRDVRAGMNYGPAECEIMEDGKPPPRAGNVFVAVHGGRSRPGEANERNLYELFDFSVTLTMRVTVPMDRVGDQLIARNLALVPLAQRQGFDARVEQLRAFLHSNWRITVLTGQLPSSANDNLAAWATGTVYGFCEPARYQGADLPVLAPAGWMGEEPDSDEFAVKAELRFAGEKIPSSDGGGGRVRVMEQIDARGNKITVIHFVTLHRPLESPSEHAGDQPWRIACMPNMVELGQTMYHPNYQHTDDPRAVSCPACQKTDSFKRAIGVYQK